ncbi:hypothetical protein JADG_007878 [Aureobasidium aubasidani]|nr:hypothetical protein JADG_007877 [Aureobasidium pullulans]KAG2168139.1 hypothetical protein JADG_007878 [Aureobasidium pullulans]
MKITANILAIALTLGLATATLSPATSNTKGKYPKSPSCSPAKTSKAIQAAECSHNTRTSKTQTFAIFKVDHQYDANHGAPYGTCEAYTCTAPTDSQLSSDSDYWTFFWNDNGESSGEGAGCIKDPQTGVITGANRGLGLALTTTLALRPNTVIFACIRTFTPETTEILTSLPVGQDSYVAPLQIDAAVPLHAKQAVESITHMYGYDHVDVVIANSGISDYYGSAAETPLEALRTHFEVNTIGPLALFQAFLPLLLQSAHPRFVAMTSGAASLSDMEHMPLMPVTAYGASKAALNYIVRKIHFENQGVCS